MNEIERIDPFSPVQIKYHPGVSDENVVCAVNDGVVIGAGFLILHQTLDASRLKVTFSIQLDKCHICNTQAEDLLLDGLQSRFYAIRKKHPDKSVYLCTYCEPDNVSYTQRMIQKGFSIYRAISVMKFDLSQPIPHYNLPEGITIQKMTFGASSMKAYLQAGSLASNDMDAEADIWFQTGDPTFACYAAMDQGRIVGAMSIWGISDERGVTENIFTVPEYRRKHIARELIATGLDELKNRGMKIATLTLIGTNLPAMKLYLSTGYQFYYYLIEFRYE